MGDFAGVEDGGGGVVVAGGRGYGGLRWIFVVVVGGVVSFARFGGILRGVGRGGGGLGCSAVVLVGLVAVIENVAVVVFELA